MARQREITKEARLLYASGKLAYPGYSVKPYLIYDRKDIKAADIRIKEWDYYFVTDGRIGLALKVADKGYIGTDSISFMDFTGNFPVPGKVKKHRSPQPSSEPAASEVSDNVKAAVQAEDESLPAGADQFGCIGGIPWEHTVYTAQLWSMGKKGMPASSLEGDVRSKAARFSIEFRNMGLTRELDFHLDGFMNRENIKGKIEISCPEEDSVVVATPFRTDEKAFCYTEKKNCMPASGYVTLGDRTYEFEEGKTFALMDWSRGVWTYDNLWYWGSASGLLEGHRFGFNIGGGYGDSSYASENMIFYDGAAHKLDKVTFKIPRSKKGRRGIFIDEFLDKWDFTSTDERFTMEFEPILNRSLKSGCKLLGTEQNQVFGRYTGKVVLDDGRVLEIKDFFGFAQKRHDRW